MTKTEYINWRWVARVLAVFLIGVEAVLNATSSSVNGFWVIVASVIITVAGATAAPFASRAWHDGQHIAAVALMIVFFPIVVIISFTSSLERVGGHADLAANKERLAGKVEASATTALTIAQSEQERACGKSREDQETRKNWPSCKNAKQAVLRTSEKLTGALTNIEDAVGAAVAKRVATLLAPLGVNEEVVLTYLPMFWPLGLLLGGFIFAHIGWGYVEERAVTAPPVETQPAFETVQLPPQKLTKDAALLAILKLCEDHGGAFKAPSGRKLADQIGASQSSLALWLRQWNGIHLSVNQKDDGIVLCPVRAKLVVSR